MLKKNSLYNKWCWENWIFTYGRLELDPYLSPCTNINSKWFNGLNVRSETVKLLQEKIWKALEHIDMGTTS
jgi:hypothetical protein